MPQRQKTDSTMPPQISEQAETRSIEPPSPIIPAPKVMASTPDARIARLENDIAELRVDVDRLLSLAQGNPALRTSLTGTALTRDQMPQTSPPSVQAGSSQLVNIRTGEHPGKTRLVMDTTAPAQFRTALDNNERILVIELPNTTFTKPLSGQLSKSPYVARYVAEAMGNGSRVIVELKQPARIVKQMVLTPTGPNGHRVMVDLGPA